MTHWARFSDGNGRSGFGAIDGDRIVEHTGDLFDRPSLIGTSIPMEGLELLAPCTPSKIVALWNNFRALAAKLEKQAPAHPLFLIKPPTSLAGPNQAVRRPRAYQGKIAFEGELGIVIGRRCKDVSVEEAMRYIFGYTCVNDITAAEVLNEDANFAQWTRAKGYDTFGCIGPMIATEFDWRNSHVVTRLDGVERQNYPLADMIYSPAEQVSRISHDMTLLPGDVIACGTSLGVGSMKDGSTIEIFIDGIGSLVNTLAA
ncbi:MAG TPA: fumarylacetoacetate hydrolase family protein [Rhizomicrobium sp.]|nr:fumarylacetoacetate hydrolase family protein [Rhizomicrobium sp.]